MSLVIAGGSRDPNLACLIRAAEERGVNVLPVLAGGEGNPRLCWDLDAGKLRIDGRVVQASGAFLRRDVFHGGDEAADHRAGAWFAALQGWLAVAGGVHTPNRRCLDRHFNKLHVLAMAREAGLGVPQTLVTNAAKALRKKDPVDRIAKPAAGGGYCLGLDELLRDLDLRNGATASPAIVQARIAGPDVRVYGIGEERVAFRIESDAVDYRTSKRRLISQIDAPRTEIPDGLQRLTEEMSLDWWAADFKLNGATGNLVFLEINSNPMFSVFDRAANCAITSALLRLLAPS